MYQYVLFGGGCLVLVGLASLIVGVARVAPVAAFNGVLCSGFGVYLVGMMLSGKRKWERSEVPPRRRRRGE